MEAEAVLLCCKPCLWQFSCLECTLRELCCQSRCANARWQGTAPMTASSGTGQCTSPFARLPASLAASPRSRHWPSCSHRPCKPQCLDDGTAAREDTKQDVSFAARGPVQSANYVPFLLCPTALVAPSCNACVQTSPSAKDAIHEAALTTSIVLTETPVHDSWALGPPIFAVHTVILH